jgi:hypothetical protein
VAEAQVAGSMKKARTPKVKTAKAKTPKVSTGGKRAARKRPRAK